MEELINALVEAFPGIDTSGLSEGTDGRITGYVTWAGFANTPQEKRQENLWRVIRAHVPPHIEINVGLILTMTPNEQQLYTTNAA